MAHVAVVHAELVLRNPEGRLMMFSSTMRAGARSYSAACAALISVISANFKPKISNNGRRLDDLKTHMDKLAKTPEGKAPAYYVVLRPKKLTPMQIDMMHPLAVLMMEQNAACVPLRPAASFEFLSPYSFANQIQEACARNRQVASRYCAEVHRSCLQTGHRQQEIN